MVFNVIHGVDPKDPSTVTTPFQFDRNIKLASLRIGVDAAAPKEFVDSAEGARRGAEGDRPASDGGAAAAADSASSRRRRSTSTCR